MLSSSTLYLTYQEDQFDKSEFKKNNKEIRKGTWEKGLAKKWWKRRFDVHGNPYRKDLQICSFISHHSVGREIFS